MSFRLIIASSLAAFALLGGRANPVGRTATTARIAEMVARRFPQTLGLPTAGIPGAPADGPVVIAGGRQVIADNSELIMVVLGVLLALAPAILVCACFAAVYVIARRSLAQTGGPPPIGDGGAASWPRRRHYLLLALVFTAVAIYGSLVPFSYRPLELHEAVERFRQIRFRSLATRGRSDFAANILLFIPVGYCWLAAFLVDRRRSWPAVLAVPLVVVLSATFSVTLEFSQLWFPGRSVAQNDLIAQSVGAMIGAALWLTVGQTITDWLRWHTASARSKSLIDWLLQAYLVALVIDSVLPLDLTINPADLVHKYRAGRITLVPFSDFAWQWPALCGLLRGVVIFIPVGMLAATGFTAAQKPVRRIGTSVLLGVLVVLGIVFAQLIVYSRPVATGDMVTGMLGVLAGAWLMRRWRGRAEDAPQPASDRPRGRAWLWLGLAGVYSLLLAVVLCWPFELVDDPLEIKARYDGFFAVPFAEAYRGSQVNVVVSVLRKVLFFGPLGALFGLAASSLSVTAGVRRTLAAVLLMIGAGVGILIELAQVYVSPHRPDVTDVILYAAGAALGMFVAVRMAGHRGATGSSRRT